MRRRVLITWVAVNNDPYERERSGGGFRLVDGAPVPGPTLTLLFDHDSPYAGTVSDVVLFFGRPSGGAVTRESRAIDQTVEELSKRDPAVRVHKYQWGGTDPTDHGQIFEFLRDRLPEVRRKFAGRDLSLTGPDRHRSDHCYLANTVHRSSGRDWQHPLQSRPTR